MDWYRFSKVGLLFGILSLAVLGATIPLLIGVPRLTVAGSYLTAPLFLSVIVYLFLRNSSSGPQSITLSDPRPIAIVFLLAMATAGVDLALFQSYQQSPVAIVALSVAGVAIFAQIAFLGQDVLQRQRVVVTILVQLAILVMVSLWRVTLRAPYYYGGTDILVHARIIDNITQRHAISVESIYQEYPLFHILSSVVRQIGALTTTAPIDAFIITGIIFATFPAVIYLFARRILPNQRFALLAAFTTAIFPTFLMYGQYSIPRSIIPLFAVVIAMLYLLDIDQRRRYLTALLLAAAIIGWHPSSFPFLILVFVLMFVAEIFASRLTGHPREVFSSSSWVSVLGLIAIVTVAHWAIIDGNMLVEIVGHLLTAFTVAGSDVSVDSGQAATSIPILDYLHWSALIFTAALGVLFIFEEDHQSVKPLSIIALGFALLLISAPGPIQALDLLETLNLRRIALYTFVLIVLTIAFGTLQLLQRVSRPSQVLILPLVCVALVLILASPAASSGVLLLADDTKEHFTEPELEGFNFAEMYTDETHVDYTTGRYFRQYIGDESVFSAEVHPDRMAFQESDENASLIVRQGELQSEGVGLRVSDSGEFDYWYSGTSFHRFYASSPLWDSLENNCQIYNSGEVEIYQCLERNHP